MNGKFIDILMKHLSLAELNWRGKVSAHLTEENLLKEVLIKGVHFKISYLFTAVLCKFIRVYRIQNTGYERVKMLT